MDDFLRGELIYGGPEMKTLARTIALLSAMLLISVGLLGQKPLLAQDMNSLAVLVNDTRNEIELYIETTSSSYQYFWEDRIQIKDWMINGELWEPAESIFSEIRLEKEARIKVEEWMIAPFGSDDSDLGELVKEEKEAPLELQKWMYCCTDWEIVLL